jgi:hypothetical protein
MDGFVLHVPVGPRLGALMLSAPLRTARNRQYERGGTGIATELADLRSWEASSFGTSRGL